MKAVQPLSPEELKSMDDAYELFKKIATFPVYD
jgi:hypothetical protein